jgi:hypothetical protein
MVVEEVADLVLLDLPVDHLPVVQEELEQLYQAPSKILLLLLADLQTLGYLAVEEEDLLMQQLHQEEMVVVVLEEEVPQLLVHQD